MIPQVMAIKIEKRGSMHMDLGICFDGRVELIKNWPTYAISLHTGGCLSAESGNVLKMGLAPFEKGKLLCIFGREKLNINLWSLPHDSELSAIYPMHKKEYEVEYIYVKLPHSLLMSQLGDTPLVGELPCDELWW